MPVLRSGLATLALLVLVGPALAEAPDPMRRASELAAAGKKEEAAELLKAAVAGAPADPAIARRAAEIYWDMGWGFESVRILDALAARTTLDFETGLLRASYTRRVGRAEAAADLFRSLVEARPDNREARLGLARALTASGQRGAARAEAREVLKAAPRDAEALVVIGQTYQWTPDAAFARRWFQKALDERPDHYEARLGMAEVTLGADPHRAEGMLRELHQRRPGDPWLQTLSDSLQKAGPPVVTALFDGYHNSNHDVDVDTFLLRASRNLSYGRTFEFAAARNVSRFGAHAEEATVEGATAGIALPLRDGHKLTLRAAIGRLTDTLGASRTRPYGNATWEFGVGRVVSGFVRGMHDPYPIGLRTLDEAITESGGGAGVSVSVPGGYSVRLTGSLVGVKPFAGNGVTRWSATLDAGRGWLVGNVLPVSLRYTFSRTEHSDRISSAGYFAPLASHSNSFTASVAGAVPPRTTGRRLEMLLSGRYSFESYDAVDDRSMTGEVAVRLHVGQGMALFAQGGKRDGSLQLGLPASTYTIYSFGVHWDRAAK